MNILSFVCFVCLSNIYIIIVKELAEKFGVKSDFLAFDFTKSGSESTDFYRLLNEKCTEMNSDGGVGLLINNVGTANEIPMNLEEFSDDDIENMIRCNIFSTIR